MEQNTATSLWNEVSCNKNKKFRFAKVWPYLLSVRVCPSFVMLFRLLYTLKHKAPVHIEAQSCCAHWSTRLLYTLKHKAAVRIEAQGCCTHWNTRLLYTLKNKAAVHIEAQGCSTHRSTKLLYTLKHKAAVHIEAQGCCTHWSTRLFYTLKHKAALHIEAQEVSIVRQDSCLNIKHDRLCTYKVMLMRVRAATFAV
jgi:hypothetical protein